jgi:acetolactate synthase regulatory subunit
VSASSIGGVLRVASYRGFSLLAVDAATSSWSLSFQEICQMHAMQSMQSVQNMTFQSKSTEDLMDALDSRALAENQQPHVS